MGENAFVVHRDDSGVAVLVLRGEHEAYGAPRLERELGALLDEGIPVVVDLSAATFVDSSTLLVFLRARKFAAERGLGFVLQMDDSTGRYVRRTFEITRLTSVFSISSSRADAVEVARAGGSAPHAGAEPA
jgi:anti-sigma B factor antagonist